MNNIIRDKIKEQILMGGGETLVDAIYLIFKNEIKQETTQAKKDGYLNGWTRACAEMEKREKKERANLIEEMNFQIEQTIVRCNQWCQEEKDKEKVMKHKYKGEDLDIMRAEAENIRYNKAKKEAKKEAIEKTKDKLKELKEQLINHRDKGIAFWASMNNAINYSQGKKPLEEVFKDQEKIYAFWQGWFLETNELGEEETKERPL